ncbi:MAG: ATP-binding protein [Coriobacteriia bacterium]
MKSLVFASGKGGTGKTTLTALVAHLLDGPGVAVADCDVEASNLPIALHATITHREAFSGGGVAVVDPDLCRGCGACARVCRFGAFVTPVGHERVYRIDAWACEGCAACVPICPYGAISMDSREAGEVLDATCAVGSMSFGQLGPGEDLSGKLVTEVRSRARAMAEEHGSDVLLIDGPPGVGCPVIAAITNTDLLVAVTEPTMSGQHDLSRLVTLARRLDVPVVVVLNKADLSESGAARLRAFAADEGLEVLGEIPFDPALASALDRFAEGLQPLESEGLLAVRGIVEAIVARLV